MTPLQPPGISPVGLDSGFHQGLLVESPRSVAAER
jgi:hypothetical protein